VRRRSLAGTCASAALAFGLLVVPQVAQTAPRNDPRAERERVQAEQAAVAAELNTTQASKEEIDAAIAVLDENLAAQESALARVQEQVAQARADIADAEAKIETLEAEITTLKAEIKRRAVQSYVSPPGDDVLSVLETSDFVTASSRKFYLELRSQDDADVTDRLDGAVSEVDYQREQAEAARQLAEEKEAEQAERTDAVRDARSQKAQLASKLEATISSQIARSIELQKTDRALAKQIAEEQAALVARLAAEKAAQEEAARKAAAEQAASAPAPTPVADPSPQNPDGSESPPLGPVSPGTGTGTGTGGIPLCTVGGITVNCAIQGQVGDLLNAARAAGVPLSGSGYRDPSRQIELRRQHCGSSYYAIYQMSPSACRPPTARPGSSQHEIGLAIDFSNCSTRGTQCYQWLAGNASRFGFYNLPSEAWHWSTTGS
jgi:hypothetical protein